MQCIKTVSYTFLINGSAQGSVNLQHGIRQGNLLSPYIFILYIEVMYSLCRVAQEEKKLMGIRVATNSPRINHLLFADDTLFFCRTNSTSVSALLEILSLHELAFGQCINPLKSSIMFSNRAPQDLKDKLKTTWESIKKEEWRSIWASPNILVGKKRSL